MILLRVLPRNALTKPVLSSTEAVSINVAVTQALTMLANHPSSPTIDIATIGLRPGRSFRFESPMTGIPRCVTHPESTR